MAARFLLSWTYVSGTRGAPTIGGNAVRGGRQDTGRPFGNIVLENTGKKVDGKCVSSGRVFGNMFILCNFIAALSIDSWTICSTIQIETVIS